VDDDPKTAWVEGREGSGVGEWIRFHSTPLEGATTVRLRLLNGYQKSKALYKANARPKILTVKLLPGGQITRVTLKDVEGWQEVRASQKAGPIQAVELRIDAEYAGSKYKDLCLSDAQVFVTATTRENPAVERGRFQRVLTWKKERLEASKLFKTEAARKIPIAPQYRLEVDKDGPRDDGEKCAWDALCNIDVLSGMAIASLKAPATDPRVKAIEIGRAGVKSKLAGWTSVQAVATDTRKPPVVDGLVTPNLYGCFEGPSVWVDEAGTVEGALELPIVGQLGYLRADGVGTFAVKQAPDLESAIAGRLPQCKSEEPKVIAWAKYDPAVEGGAERLRALFLVACGIVEVRDGAEQTAVAQLLVYDDAGHLTLLASRGYATLFDWQDRGGQPVLTAGHRFNSFGGPPVKLLEHPAKVKR